MNEGTDLLFKIKRLERVVLSSLYNKFVILQFFKKYVIIKQFVIHTVDIYILLYYTRKGNRKMFTQKYVPKHLDTKPIFIWLLLYQIFTPYTPKRLQQSVNKNATFIRQVLYIVHILFKRVFNMALILSKRFSSVAKFLCRNVVAYKEAIMLKISNKYFVSKIYLCVLALIVVSIIVNAILAEIMSAPETETALSTAVEVESNVSEFEEEKEEDIYSELFMPPFLQLNNMHALGMPLPEALTLQLNNAEEDLTEVLELVDEVVEEVIIEETPLLPEEVQTELLDEEPVDVPAEEIIPITGVSIEVNGTTFSVSPVLYVHIGEDPKAPLEVSTTRISDDDIMVDLSNPFSDKFVYSISAELEKAMSKLICAESGNQPFDGQLSVGEDVRNSLFSGVYGYDLNATCEKQFLTSLEVHSDGTVHLYRDRVELTETTDSTDAAAALAVRGTNITGLILEAVTQIRNEQFPNWNLDERYYASGAFFHYAPKLLNEKQLAKRAIGQVPVSYRLEDHVFYSVWINAKYALK